MRFASGLAWILAVAVSGSATGQSMGEAAAKEKKRREAAAKAAADKAKGKSYSDEDLPKSDPTVEGPVAPDESRPVTGDDGKRARAAEIKKSLDECHATLTAARAAAKAAEEGPELTPTPEDNPFIEEPPAEEPPEAEAAPADTPPSPPPTKEQKVLEAKAFVARTVQQCDDIEDSARKAGIPPGWIR